MEIWQLLDSRGLGGIESHVLTLAAGLRARGHDARVMFLADHGAHPLRETLDARDLPWEIAGGARGLARRLAARRPALVHTHGYKAGILGRVLSRTLRLPVLSSFHAGEPGVGRLRLYTALDRWTARLAPRVAVSPAIAATLPGSVSIVPNFVPRPVAPPDRPARRPVLGFVGRLSPEKGPDLFLTLARRLAGRMDCVLFGDGPMRAALAGDPGAGAVEFMGAKPSMAPHWGGIDLLCVPSRHEGLPMAVLEAMAHGCPVAAFDVGALGEVIEHRRTGFLVAALDLDGLEGAVAEWLDMPAPDRAAMATAATDAVTARYGLDAGIDRMLALYAAAGARSNSKQHQSSGG